MQTWFSINALLTAGFIFSLRVLDMSIDTLRVLFVMRGRKGIAWVLGFFQALIFIVAISSVLQDLDNPLSILGYVAGFATGNVVGLFIEGKLAIGHVQLSIVSPRWGPAIATQLRAEGFAVTEIPARGRDGMVSMLNCSILRRNVARAHKMIQEIDQNAFITAEDVRPLRRGFWRA